MALPQPFVPNTELQVAANLRYTDANGDLVYRLYPNEYTSLIGANVSTLKAQYVQVTAILADYGARITTLETQVDNILTSGVTFMLYVNSACLYDDNITHPIDEAFNLLSSASCSYFDILGTTTALANGIAAETPATLNTLPAYSQNSAMAGIAGWDSDPVTVAATINNIWKAYLDMRVGVTQALNQSNITCADIHINYQGVYNQPAGTITMYFYGSYIPTNFSASSPTSGTFTITDTSGNIYTQTFNIYSTVAAGFITLDISASALLPNSNYTVLLEYSVTSTTPLLGCSGGIPGSVVNNFQICPNLAVTPSGTTMSYSFNPTVLTSVTYTVAILDASGSTIIETKSYNTPAGPTSDIFANLTPDTAYTLRMQVAVNDSITLCPLVYTQTTS